MLGMWYIGPEVYMWGQANNYCLAFVAGIFYQEITNIEPFTNWIHNKKWLKFYMGLFATVGVLLATKMDPLSVTIFGMRISFWIHTAIYNAIGFFGMMGIFIIAEIISKLKVKSLFIWIGEISFMIYVLHNPFMYLPVQSITEYKFVMTGFGLTMCLIIGSVYVYKIQPWLLGKKEGKRDYEHSC